MADHFLARLKLALCAMLAAFSFAGAAAAQQDKVVTVTFAAAWTSANPYVYSSAETNAIFCQSYGCLGTYDYKSKKPIGVLAESWEWVNSTTMRFKLRQDLKRHDGGPGVTAKDVIHSLDITLNDKDSVRRSFTRDIKEIREVDTYTFDMITKAPAVDLIISVFDSFIITSADLWKQHGRDVYTKAPHGWGPYKIENIAVDDRAVLRKFADWKGHDPKSPDVVIYRLVREPEQRVTGLLNGEIQVLFSTIAQVAGHVAAGKVRLVAVASPERSHQARSVPTLAELGYKELTFVPSVGALAPAGTPAPIVRALADEMRKALTHPDSLQRYERIGIDVVASTPEAYAATLKSDVVSYSRAVKASGASVD